MATGIVQQPNAMTRIYIAPPLRVGMATSGHSCARVMDFGPSLGIQMIVEHGSFQLLDLNNFETSTTCSIFQQMCVSGGVGRGEGRGRQQNFLQEGVAFYIYPIAKPNGI